jgi:serine/threonine protein kinase/Tfp pilus assembly protein PilF
MPTLQFAQGDEPIPGSGFRVVSFLGRGSFGEVWKARAPGGSEAALKIIRLGSRGARKEFRALQLVKRVRHPNLVPIFGFWLKASDGRILDDTIDSPDVLAKETGPLTQTMVLPSAPPPDAPEELVIAMGLGDKSLSDRLKECQAESLPGIPQEELLGYLEDSAEAIDFLNRPIHDFGNGRAAIQHGDIKPLNLMIVGGSVQVCDFGLARMLGSERATTAAGTIAYAAPEVLLDNKPSVSTDQYSLAITYYELKTGKLPYDDDSLATVLAAKREATMNFADLPVAEQAVLKRATLRNPEERYASCREMVAALRSAASGECLPPIGPMRRSWLPAMIILLFVAVAAGGAWFAWLRPWPFDRPVAVAPSSIPISSAAQTTDLPKAGRQGNSHDSEPGVHENTGHDPANAKAAPRSDSAIAKHHAEEAKPIAPPSKESLPEKHFQHGSELLNAKKYDEAISEFKQAIQLDPGGTLGYAKRPDYGNAYLERGTQALTSQDFAAAVPDLEQAAIFLPKEAKVFSRLGAAWSGQKRWDRAVESYTAAIQIDLSNQAKPHALDYQARGQAYQAIHATDNAIADFRQCTALDPKNAQAFAKLADAYLDKEDPENAIRSIDHAIQICRDDPNANVREFSARHLRAYAYLKLGKNDEAAADLQRVFDLAQSDQDRASSHELFYALSVKFEEAKHYADAALWIKKAIDFAPDEATRSTYREHAKTYPAKPAASP